MKNKPIICIYIFILVCIIWLLNLSKNKHIKNTKQRTIIYKNFNTQTCEELENRANFETTKNVSENILEYNYDYLSLLKCFNLDESRFFHMPFVSYIVLKRWVFQGFANHIYSSNVQDFFPENVQCGDIIYVKTDYINNFFENYHKDINNPYILITHQSDFAVGYPRQLNFLDDPKIIVWFGQNVIAKSEINESIQINIGYSNKFS